MVLAVIDIETNGLDATQFIIGCYLEENKKPLYFYDKNSMWQYIMKRGKQCLKNRQTLNIYGHNIQYDFYGIMNLNEKGLRIVNTHPFIVFIENKSNYIDEYGNIKIKTRQYIKFLDTWALARMSLKKAGEILNLNKLETPQSLINANANNINPDDYIEYVTRDCEIAMKIVKTIKEKLKKDDITVRMLFTIGQVAINYINNTLIKLPEKETEHIYYDRKFKTFFKSKYPDLTHKAYKGGRVEAFKTGIFENCSLIDRKSAYGKSLIDIDFPDLRTERKINKPLEFTTPKELFNKIGISKCMLLNKSCKLGLLPIRTKKFSYVPRENKYLIGSWTHSELKVALQNGYKLIDIEYSIIWEKGYNVFKKIIPEIYEKRKENNDPFNNYFYKAIIVNCVGKFGQYRAGTEIIIDSTKETENYLKKGFDRIGGYKTNWIYKKDKTKNQTNTKPYYAPIIPALVTANSRIALFNKSKELDYNKLLYSDTDSIMFIEHNKKPKTTNKLGEFDYQNKNQNAIIYGRKTYAIGKDIKISGFRKSDITLEDFENGTVESKKMITLLQNEKLKDIGKFRTEKINLKDMEIKNKKIINKINNLKICIDEDILDDIEYFNKHLIKLV